LLIKDGAVGVLLPEVRIQEMPARAQHAKDFAKKLRHVGVAVRSLDIDHRVKGFVSKVESQCIPARKAQARRLVPPFALRDRAGIAVHSVHRRWLEVPSDTRRPAPMPATDLQDAKALQRDRPNHAVVKLNASTIRLVFRSEHGACSLRPVFSIPVIEECNRRTASKACEQRIPKFPQKVGHAVEH
jgi:hypothetical protein